MLAADITVTVVDPEFTSAVDTMGDVSDDYESSVADTDDILTLYVRN